MFYTSDIPFLFSCLHIHTLLFSRWDTPASNNLVPSVEKEDMEAGLETWIISYTPTQWNSCLFPERWSHTVALSPCTACSTMGKESLPRTSLFPTPHTPEDQNSYSTQRFCPLQPPEVTGHLSKTFSSVATIGLFTLSKKPVPQKHKVKPKIGVIKW